MVDNIVSKPLGLVLIVTAYMVFNGPSQAEVTGILGTNITFEFTFNISVTKTVSIYTANNTKIAGYSQGKSSSRGADFDIYPKNTSVFLHITNLKLDHSGIYWASLFTDSYHIPSNNKLHLIVREENKSSTEMFNVFAFSIHRGVLPMNDTNITNEDSGSIFPSHIITVLAVLPMVLLAAILPLLIWCLVRSNDKQQQPQELSNPTVQEIVEASNDVPAPPLVYSVLDFPRRPQTVMEINPNDTEYAAVSYLPDKRQV